MRILRRLLPVLLLACAALALSPGDSGAPEAVRPAEPEARPARPHAILLILDELPGDSLLDDGGRIDPVRYPNFAKLAAGATWFRNAHSIYDSTTKAVPLILDARRPRPGSSPDRRGHPRSIFDMFARRGYRTVASEEATALCPPRLCRGGRSEQAGDHPADLGHGRPGALRLRTHGSGPPAPTSG